jgi:pimeloyl-ACP methyl ester carboxylesterase
MATTSPPNWFRRALNIPFTNERTEVAGAPIHYLAWGEPGQRGLVFVHGGGAHAHWWTHVAATFAGEFRVLAIDLSGHGDSGHRDEYTLEGWTDEVAAVATAGGIAGSPVVIGHSMGGFVTIATAARHAEHVAGAIVCDSPVTEPDPEIASYRLKEAFGAPRTYASVEDGMAHFRTVPPQAEYLDFRHVFSQFGGSLRSVALPYLDDITCRLALLRSEYGLVTADIGRFMYERLGRVTPVVEIPEAGHHAMLDQPLVLLTAIRSLLADWDHSDPHHRR